MIAPNNLSKHNSISYVLTIKYINLALIHETNKSVLKRLEKTDFALGIADIGHNPSGFAIFYKLGITNMIATSATPASSPFYHFLGLAMPVEVPGILFNLPCFIWEQAVYRRAITSFKIVESRTPWHASIQLVEAHRTITGPSGFDNFQQSYSSAV